MPKSGDPRDKRTQTTNTLIPDARPPASKLDTEWLGGRTSADNMVMMLAGNAKATNKRVVSIVRTRRHRVGFCCNKEPANAKVQPRHAASGTFLCVLGY